MKLQSKFIFFLLIYGCSNDLSETSKIRSQILSQYTKEMKTKGLYTAGKGGGSKNHKISLIDVCFDANRVLDIEKARKLMVDATMNLLVIIKNKKYHNYFEMFPVSINIIHISIVGQEKNDDNPNYIQFVSIINGKIFYNIKSDIAQFPPLITIHEETFEEAQRILSQSNHEVITRTLSNLSPN